MPDKLTQFFHETTPGPRVARLPGESIAIYEVAGKTQDGSPLTVAVECVEGGGSNLPQNATSLRDVVGKLKLETEFGAIAGIAKTALDGLKALKPGEVEIEFGVELGGELGIPMITKGEAKANFKITLKWRDEGSGK